MKPLLQCVQHKRVPGWPWCMCWGGGRHRSPVSWSSWFHDDDGKHQTHNCWVAGGFLIAVLPQARGPPVGFRLPLTCGHSGVWAVM